MKISTIKNYQLIIIFVIAIFLLGSYSFASLIQDGTVEIYLAPGQNILSESPNTLSVNKGIIDIILNNGSRVELLNKKKDERFKIADYYLTVKYSQAKHKIYFYNHGRKIKSFSLEENSIKIKDLILDLKDKYDKEQISYFKSTHQALSEKRIVNTYYKIYPTVKVSPPPALLKTIVMSEPTLAQLMVLTTNGVLSFSASNINNGNTPASNTITTALWTDLTSSMGNNGVLTNFPQPTGSTNGYSGWDGLNSVSIPSALKFSGEVSLPAPTTYPTLNYVDTGTDPGSALKFTLTNSFSVETWINRDILNSAPYAICGTVAGNGSLNTSAGTGTRGYFLSVEGGCYCPCITPITTPTNTVRFGLVDSGTIYQYSDTSSLNFPSSPSATVTCTTPQQIPYASGSSTFKAPNTWHHIVGTWDGTNVKTYLDGVPDSTVTTMGVLTSITSTNNFLVGLAPGLTASTTSSGGLCCISNSVYFMGQIGRLRIYNAALSDAQVRQNYIAEGYRYQCADILPPGIKGDENFINATHKKAGDTFNVYVSDTNKTFYGDNDIASISSVSCMIGSVSLTTPTPTELNYNGGLTFDGTDDYIQCGNILNQTTNDFTLEALVKMPYRNTSVENILCKRDISSSMNAGFQIFKNPSGYFGAIIGDGSADRIEVDGAQYAISNNSWHHVAAVFKRTGNLTIYVDGMADGSDSISSEQSSITNSSDLRIGQNSTGTETFRGSIANVRIYSRALSSDEVYRNARYRLEPFDFHNLLAWWKFDDATSNPGTNTLAAKKWDTATNAVIADATLNGTLTNFGLISTSTNGWASQFQHAYNINKYVFTVPTFPADTLNQVEEFNCTLTDAATNTVTEEVSDVFVSKQPTVFTNIVNNSTYKLADIFTITAVDSSPASGLFTNPTVPSSVVDVNTFTPTCNITSFTTLKKAITFDGINDYVSVGNAGSNIRTISFWANPGSITTNLLELSSSINITASAGAIMATGITNPIIYVNGAASNNLTANVWQYITVVSDTDLNASSVNIGRVGNSYYAGQLDDVQFYSRSLSQNETTRLYNTPGRVINAFKLEEWLRFERLEDTNLNGVLDNIRDFSSAGRPGTLNNYGSALTSALVDSTVSGIIDGTIGTCDVTITSSNPPGPLNSNTKTLTTSASNSLTQSGTETKTINLLRDQKPAIPTVLSANVGSTSLGLTGSYTVGIGQTLAVNFTSLDPDIGNTVTLSLVNPAPVGTFTSNAPSNPGTGNFTFTPNATHSGMNYSFAVQATDNIGTMADGTVAVSFSVNNNTPPTKPTISSALIDDKSVDKNGTYTIGLGQKITLGFNAIDPDANSTVALSLVNPPGIGVFAPVVGTGDASFVYTAISNDAGMTFNFNVRATDNFSVNSASDLPISLTIQQAPITVINTSSTSSTTGGSTTSTGGSTTSTGGGSTTSSTTSGSLSSSGQAPIEVTQEDLNNLPLIDKAEFIKFPVGYVEGLQENINYLLANSENAFLIPKEAPITEDLLSLKLNQAKLLVRIIDKNQKEFDVLTFPVLTLLETKPILFQTKLIPNEISDGEATLVLIVDKEPIAKFNISIIHPPLKAANATLTNLLKPSISLVSITKKIKTLKLIIVGANIFNKEIFKEGNTVPTETIQTSISLLPRDGLELQSFKISKISKINAQSKITTVYKLIDTIPQKLTLSVLTPYGQTLKTINSVSTIISGKK